MRVYFEGIELRHDEGWFYADIYMPTAHNNEPHAVDVIYMAECDKPTEIYLYMVLKNWVKTYYAQFYVNE